MEQLLREFMVYDQKTKQVIVDYLVKTHEKFFISLKFANIPAHVVNPIYDPDETVSHIENNPEDISEILKKCNSASFLENIKYLSGVKHPMLSQYRFIKPRDFNQTSDSTKVLVFLYPKSRLWLFFKYQQLWCIIKNREIEEKKKLRNFFNGELRRRFTNDALYVLEVCYETRRTDDVTSYHVLDVYDFDNVSFATKPFEYRYNFLSQLNIFDILPTVNILQDVDKYLLRKKQENLYNRTDYTLNLSRLKMDQYYLLVGETHTNDKTKVYVAKLDPTYNKFHIVGFTTKNKLIIPKKNEYSDKGICIFGVEYSWKCTHPHTINYYKNPIAAKLMIMANKVNMRSLTKEVLDTPPLDRAFYVTL